MEQFVRDFLQARDGMETPLDSYTRKIAAGPQFFTYRFEAPIDYLEASVLTSVLLKAAIQGATHVELFLRFENEEAPLSFYEHGFKPWEERGIVGAATQLIAVEGKVALWCFSLYSARSTPAETLWRTSTLDDMLASQGVVPSVRQVH